MENFLNELNFTHWMWFVSMILFLGLEALLPGVIFLWLGIAASVLGFIVLALPEMTWEAQLVWFSVLSVISVFSGRYYLKRKGGITTEAHFLNRRGDALVGRTVTVSTPIKNGMGKVKVGDTQWTAEGADAKSGEQVIVTKVDGATLYVEAKPSE